MTQETKLIEGYWVIGTNKWSANRYTKEQAEKYASTLINCDNCINCSYCRDCSYCLDCRGCSDCSGCSYCLDCLGCSGCRSCRDCSSCLGCSGCRSCRDCSYCSDFKTNPQRITSPVLGSGDSQTTFYWNEDKEQIVCGCFKGTLEQFEAKVKETHGDNEFAQGYLKWIDAVKFYKLTIRR